MLVLSITLYFLLMDLILSLSLKSDMFLEKTVVPCDVMVIHAYAFFWLVNFMLTYVYVVVNAALCLHDIDTRCMFCSLWANDWIMNCMFVITNLASVYC